jgi:DNA-binding transcriptional ArsR family regulator
MRNHSATPRASSTAFQAIADPTRRAVLDLLRQGSLPAGHIARAFPITRPAVSKHLGILRRAKLVRGRQQGRNFMYELNPEPLKVVDAWLEHYRGFWQSSLTRLKALVESDAAGEASNRKSEK